MQNQQPSNLQMSYEQYQQSLRKKQEQEQLMARQALKQAGADSGSDKIRSLMNQLQGIQSELKLAENQIQMQMDAQRRQFTAIMDRVGRLESDFGQLLNQPQVPIQ